MNKLKGHTTYLIGPIDHADDCGVGWRNNLKPFLWSMGMGVFDPCDKPIGKSEDSVLVKTINKLKDEGKWQEAKKVVKKIVNIDLTLLDLSTIPIMYIDKEVHSCGSYSEATYAALEKKALPVVIKQGKKHVPNWLIGILNPDLFFSDFDELRDFLTQVNKGKVQCPKLPDIDFEKVYNKTYLPTDLGKHDSVYPLKM